MQRNRRNSSRRGGKRSRGSKLAESNSGAASRGAGDRPPQIATTVESRHRFRFSSDSGLGPYSITRVRLLELLQVANTATTASRIIQAARIRSVELWSEPAALGATQNTVGVEWSGLNAPSVLHSDTSMGVKPAHVFSAPPPNSSSKWWSINGQNETETLFILRFSGSTFINCTIDIVVDLRFIELEAAVSSSIAPAAATAGTLYYNYLDGFTSKKLTPIGGTVQV